jgi:hypothetical protein
MLAISINFECAPTAEMLLVSSVTVCVCYHADARHRNATLIPVYSLKTVALVPRYFLDLWRIPTSTGANARVCKFFGPRFSAAHD